MSRFKSGDRVCCADDNTIYTVLWCDKNNLTLNGLIGRVYDPSVFELVMDKQAQNGIKHDSDKPPMELLSHQALVEIAKAFGFGAKRYGKYNYKKGLNWGRIIGAAYRHLGAFNSGEASDPDSGLSHVAHLGCCVIMLLDYIKDHPELDDRYKKEPK